MTILTDTRWYIGVMVLPLFGFGQDQVANMGDMVVTSNTVMSTVGNFINRPMANFINNGDVYVYGHWQNDGTTDHDNQGLTRFVGNSVQQIKGSTISYFNSLEFDNATSQSAFELSGTISIAGEVNFLEGVVNNKDHGGTITFERDATHTNTSNYSHVNGKVEKVGDRDFEFPVGHGTYYRKAIITAPGNSADMFTSRYFLETPDFINNLSDDVAFIDQTEYWLIERTTGDSDVMVTLSWDEETTSPQLLEGSVSNLRIVRWDESRQLWVDQGGVVDEVNQTVTTAVDGYGLFTLAKSSLEIPCEYMEVFNLITPNNDGVNDAFNIGLSNDSCISELHVEIFNRWGVKVYESSNYENESELFDGYSHGRATIIGDNKTLPTGTYFYVLKFKSDFGGTQKEKRKTGYLYIN